jgi:hypothetical protein
MYVYCIYIDYYMTFFIYVTYIYVHFVFVIVYDQAQASDQFLANTKLHQIDKIKMYF